MKRFAAITAAILATAPAFAGGVVQPAAEPAMVVAPAPAPAFDWTGFQVGVVLGWADTTTTLFEGEGFETELDATSNRYGVIARYLHDMGDFVVGGQLMYEHVQVEDDLIDDATRLGVSVLGGYDLGRFLPYAHVGVTHFDTGTLDTVENGFAYGLGAMFAVTDNIVVSIDYTRTEYTNYLEDAGGFLGAFDNELSADAVRLAATFRF